MPGAHLDSKTVLSHLGVMVAVSAVLGVLVAGLTIPFAGVAGLGARTAADSLDQLPAELETEPLPERTRVLDANGELLATFYDENRVNIPLEDVAPIMRQAIIAIEDSRFYQHGALDLRGTLRALITNTASDDVVQGGSSITQQMVKLTLVAQAETAEERRAAIEETYERKFNELRYAIAFEEQYSKNWILERYLNLAYFGAGAYGIQAAARTYFSKPASKLTLRESAMLAGLVQNPSRYDPTNNREGARTRRDVVLNRMAQLGVVSDDEAQQALDSNLGLKVSTARDGCISSRAPFFCDYARRYLLADESLGETQEQRAQLLNTSGLTITTTLDLRMQRAADRATSEAVNPTAQAIGGLALVQPRTGAVKALSQSRPMGRDRSKGESFLNYVVDSEYGDANGFQPGSTFKVFTLAAAIMQGIPLNTEIYAPETISIPEQDYRTCDGPYTSTEVWEPSNSTGSGTFDLYTGTRQSVNTFFAQLLLRTGLCQPYRLAKEMGIRLTSPETERVPSFTLGVADVSPLEMAGAYATFAARGLACENRPIQEIRTATGELFKEYERECDRVMRRPVADAVNDILRGVMEGGFGSGFALEQPSAGKTGTTNSNRAVWFVGYTPNLSTAAVVAGANQQGEPTSLNGTVINGSPVYGAAGSTLAGPIWGQTMQEIAEFLPDRDFVAPPSSLTQTEPEPAPVPDDAVVPAPEPAPAPAPPPPPPSDDGAGDNGGPGNSEDGGPGNSEDGDRGANNGRNDRDDGRGNGDD